ncbi:hypothetical protein MLD38_025637 [Melastoma candidum]|uniref:Uncharacterized protein n=1 Tax=Melastoma candidum TaxID=119954 RepID=A0ACB9NXJ9_9MYRT|nr:hypothetical protein MLD38_025637 [Melastoma candidum]
MIIGELSRRDFAQPTPYEPIRFLGPAIQANNFEIKPAILNMIENSSFSGLSNEDPHWHLTHFEDLCDTLRYNGVSPEAVRLRMFPFSLRDKTRAWLYSLPRDSFNTWEELSRQFLAKYYSPNRTVRLRNKITSFCQQGTESMYEAWEMFKELQRLCPHHEIPTWMLVQSFYDGLAKPLQLKVDSAARGTLMNKTPDEALELFE